MVFICCRSFVKSLFEAIDPVSNLKNKWIKKVEIIKKKRKIRDSTFLLRVVIKNGNIKKNLA